MAVTTAKENLMCLAFAYFMDTRPDRKGDAEHLKSWETLFNDFKVSDVKAKYKTYLEYGFDYNSLKSSYSYTKKASHAHVVVAYKQVEKLYYSGIISRSKEYRLYTQSSTFTKTVKDACLKKLKDVFGIKGDAQILSPVDFFLVNYPMKADIEKEFKTNILNVKSEEQLLLNYYKNKDKTYEHMIANYFKSKDLIGVSHKMLSSKSSVPSIKIAGNIRKLGKYDEKYIDPYSQFVILLKDKNPGQVEQLINDVIDVKYSLWNIRENLDSSSWKLVFDFNYKKLNNQFQDARFNLEPLPSGGSGSYNGKFDIKKGEAAKTPWVAGMSPKTLEPLLSSYSGYNTIMEMLAKKRVQAFLVASDVQREAEIDTPEGQRALTFLKKKQFHSYNELKKALEPHFEQIGNKQILQNYLRECVKLIREEGKYSTKLDMIRTEKILSNHYVSLQMSYFWIAGGRNFKLFLKKQIFFTIFGAITKRSFGRVTASNVLVEAMTKQVMADKKKQVEVSITSAPHVIMM
jgi:hypothetical protein